MKNLDQTKKDFLAKIKQMVESNDPEQRAEAIEQIFGDFRQQVLDEARAFGNNTETAILAARGVRQLLPNETAFYQRLIDAQQSGVANFEEAIPETIIDQVINDVQEEHPLLNALDIINTAGRTTWLLNATDTPLAVWGRITSAITEEIEGAIEVVDFSSCKLSAFMFIPKDILELGVTWVDRYARLILAEALLGGLSYGAINGNGKNQPIGARKDLDGNVVDGVYPDKEKVALTSLDPIDYCAVIAPMAKNSATGKARVVNRVLLVCNPVDYISKILPATTTRAADGTYNNNIFPFPTSPIQDAQMPEGEALLIVDKKYKLFISGNKNGTVDASDQYKFLEDYRTYVAKLFGYGRATDNNAAVLLDISGLSPANLKVEVVGTVSTKEQA